MTVVHPVQREVVEWDEYTGRLRSTESVEIRPRVSGYLASIHFKDGQMVKAGDLLFIIDPRPYEAEVERSQAALAQAQASMQLAEANFARSQQLRTKQVIAQQEFDTESNSRRTAQAAEASAQAALTTAKLNLEFTHVMTPVSGRVSRYRVSTGNLISGGGTDATLLTTVVSLDPLYCYFEVDEQSFMRYAELLRRLRSGAQGANESKSLPVEMRVAGEEGFPRRGWLDFVDNQVDAETSTVELRGVFSNSDLKLAPGLFARVRIPAREKSREILIPDEAVGTNQSVEYVYIVGAGHKIELRRIELGPLVEGLRVVRKGVGIGDLVVTDGLQSVRPGTVVTPEEQAAGPPGESAGKP